SHRNGHRERPQAAWREREIGLEQALELEERLVVEDNVVDLIQRHAGLAQTVLDRVRREARGVLLARESLFLSRRRDTAVLDQRGRAVVIEGRDAKDPHGHALELQKSV